MLSTYLHTFLDLFYPRLCLHCNRDLNNSLEFNICSNCKQHIPYRDDAYCIRCGATLGPYSISDTKEGCTVCKGRYLHFETITPVTYYDGVIKTLIHKFKYARQEFLSSVLNDIILADEKLKETILNIDMIIPVPLYWLKKLHRGFNQSELLSRGIQKHFFKPLSTDNLCRIKNTLSQTQLSKNQRQANVHNAFFVKYPESLKGKRILLVDDVLTTGITATECSRKLKEAGAKSIHLLILATARR